MFRLCSCFIVTSMSGNGGLGIVSLCELVYLLYIIIPFHVVSLAPIVLKNITRLYVGNFVGKIVINSYKIKINKSMMDIDLLEKPFTL